MTNNFGIVTACWQGDYFLVKATCASIRYFMGDIPICVIVDGNFSIEELEKLYNVKPLYLSQLSNPELRKICPGSTRAKLAAIWEGPFDRFIYMDSDAIAWGNLVEKFDIDLENFDFVVMRPDYYGFPTEEQAKTWFFDVDTLKKVAPEYEWQNQPYFCAGAFAARRNCLDLDEYLRLEGLAEEYPELFKFWDQGVLNYMVFSASQAGKLKYKVIDMQVVTGEFSKNELEGKYPSSIYKIPKEPEKPAILHFCGEKPFLHKPNAFSKPFTAFRLLHYQKLIGDSVIAKGQSISKIIFEELELISKKVRKKVNTLIKAS
jgi:lipopolysaccharide biosynthesis glycosyltransferase